MASVAILGGTFDPVHIGHLAIAEDVRHALKIDRVLFIPTAQQPLKPHTHNASAADRLAMVRAATADNVAFAVSDIEVQRGGMSYTVDTIATLRSHYPNTDLSFIMGADAATELPRWREVDRLLSMCRIVVLSRPGYSFDPQQLIAQVPAAAGRIDTLRGPALEISATEIRQRIREGWPVRYHLPAAVLAYIEARGLYRSSVVDHAR